MRQPAISFSYIAMLILLTSCASTEDQAAKALEDTGQVRPNSNYQRRSAVPRQRYLRQVSRYGLPRLPYLQRFCRIRYRRQSQAFIDGRKNLLQ
jgi:hypothetical protein